MRVSSWEKPRSNSRSASSMIRTSKLEAGAFTYGLDKSSARRPGVAMSRLGESRRNALRSSAAFVVPPTRSCGTIAVSVVAGRFSSLLLYCNSSEDGPWNLMSARRTL